MYLCKVSISKKSMKYRIYLDNCCFNRPYDDQQQARVRFETQAKLCVQQMALDREVELVWSYMLKYENSRNPFEAKRYAIAQWEKVSSLFIAKSDEVTTIANAIATTSVSPADALHVACAIVGSCRYFITVDRRLLAYRDERIAICNPIEFLNEIMP